MPLGGVGSFYDRSCIARRCRPWSMSCTELPRGGESIISCPAGFSTTAACGRFARLDNGAAPNARHTRLRPNGPLHPTSSAAGSCTPHPGCEAPSARRGRSMPTRATPAVRASRISPTQIRPFHESRRRSRTTSYSSAIKGPSSLAALRIGADLASGTGVSRATLQAATICSTRKIPSITRLPVAEGHGPRVGIVAQAYLAWAGQQNDVAALVRHMSRDAVAPSR
jgi:hypothetical protein